MINGDFRRANCYWLSHSSQCEQTVKARTCLRFPASPLACLAPIATPHMTNPRGGVWGVGFAASRSRPRALAAFVVGVVLLPILCSRVFVPAIRQACTGGVCSWDLELKVFGLGAGSSIGLVSHLCVYHLCVGASTN